MRYQRDGPFVFEPVTQQKSTNDVSEELVLLSYVQNNTLMWLLAFKIFFQCLLSDSILFSVVHPLGRNSVLGDKIRI